MFDVVKRRSAVERSDVAASQLDRHNNIRTMWFSLSLSLARSACKYILLYCCAMCADLEKDQRNRISQAASDILTAKIYQMSC